MPTARPHITRFDALTRPDNPAATLGYRMPAEWEKQAGVWVVRPHNQETWPGCLAEAQKQFDAWVDAMSDAVPVSTTDELGIATNDSWIRDFGPIFVVSKQADQAPLACHDFRFNGWGNKYENRDRDDMVPQRIARHLHLPIWVHDFVLEGGSIDVNGQGVALTTEQCLLNQNRNPDYSREDIEHVLAQTLGIHHVIWLPGGIVGDDTDGHIDDIARFVAPNRIVAVAASQGHPDHDMLARNLTALRGAHDPQGNPFDIITLPSPEPIVYDFPPDRFGPGGRAPVPASYANFLIANGSVFVPVFKQSTDKIACALLQKAMPDYHIQPIHADKLVVGLGGLHCLSQQQPCAL